MKHEKQYTWHYLDGYYRLPEAGPFRREAEGRFNLYTKAPVFLPDNGILCGNLDLALEKEVVTNRISRHFFQKEAYDAVMASDAYAADEKENLRAAIARFEPEILSVRADAVYSEDEMLAWESNLATSNHFNGHQVLDYGLLLREGIPGLIRLFLAHRDQCAISDPGKIEFYDALRRTFEGTALFIERHAALAEERAASLPEGDERRRRKETARICHAIARSAPASFTEGLALLWFFIGFADYDSSGRFDQYLYPLYEKSLAEGMTREEAGERMKDFWLLLDRNGAILNMTIGGSRPDGSSAVNDLTFLVLEVTRELRLKGPNLCLRLGPDESARLWEEIHTSLSAGQALPALYNESEIIPMLIREGISPEDAYDFCLAGCSQVVIPGKSSFACDIGTYNTLKCLELALHDGYDLRIRKQVGPHTGKPESFTEFESLLQAYTDQTCHAIEVGTGINNKDHGLRTDFCSCIRSALTSDCVERGKPLFQGGARYYAVQNEVIGLTNTANALLAIRYVVYDQKRLSLKELTGILDDDFRDNEVLRRFLIHRVPKFGNGIEEIDELRSRLTDAFFTRLSSYPAPLGGRHWPGEVIFHYNTQLGRTTLASADGRRAGEPLADSSGPSQGTDREGVLGIFQSMGKLRFSTDRYPNTCSCLNLKFDLGFWERARQPIIDLLRTYMKTGFQLQINVLNAADLEEALIHPENYGWLVVRVGGYSAYFTSLDPGIQRDIVSRTTQLRVQ